MATSNCAAPTTSVGEEATVVELPPLLGNDALAEAMFKKTAFDMPECPTMIDTNTGLPAVFWYDVPMAFDA
jgi:hypothetical protein